MSGSDNIFPIPREKTATGIHNTFRDYLISTGRSLNEGAKYEILVHRDFRHENLNEIDFTASILSESLFEGALIEHARFDLAVLGKVMDGENACANLMLAADWFSYVKRWTKMEEQETDGHIEEFELFQDAPFAPLMVRLRMPLPMAVSVLPLTVSQLLFFWNEMPEWRTEEFSRWTEDKVREHPRHVISLLPDESDAVLQWLNQKTGQKYRVISNEEWTLGYSSGVFSATGFTGMPEERTLEGIPRNVFPDENSPGPGLPLPEHAFSLRIVRELNF